VFLLSLREVQNIYCVKNEDKSNSTMWNSNIKLNIKQNIAKSKRITKHWILKHTSVISRLWIRPKLQPEQRPKILWYVWMSQCHQYPYVIDMPVRSDHQNDIRKVHWYVRGSESTWNTRLSCVCDISCMNWSEIRRKASISILWDIGG
jgi:hypothetical protein